MSGNKLTVVSTLAGIIVGFLTSWWLTPSGKRDAQKKQLRRHDEISVLKSLLSSGAESVTKSITPNVETLQPARLPDKRSARGRTSLRPASTSASGVLVRASLGALLNEHGEVSLQRLFKGVMQDLPGTSLSSVLSSPEMLGESGKVSWQGMTSERPGSLTFIHNDFGLTILAAERAS
jgi:hypothetical protein